MDGCDATIEAASESAVLAKAETHAADAHPDLDLDEETVATIREHIQDV